MPEALKRSEHGSSKALWSPIANRKHKMSKLQAAAMGIDVTDDTLKAIAAEQLQKTSALGLAVGDAGKAAIAATVPFGGTHMSAFWMKFIGILGLPGLIDVTLPPIMCALGSVAAPFTLGPLYLYQKMQRTKDLQPDGTTTAQLYGNLAKQEAMNIIPTAVREVGGNIAFIGYGYKKFAHELMNLLPNLAHGGIAAAQYATNALTPQK